LCYEQCPKNSFKKLYTLKGLLVLVEKASFSKEFLSEFHSGGGGKIFSMKIIKKIIKKLPKSLPAGFKRNARNRPNSRLQLLSANFYVQDSEEPPCKYVCVCACMNAGPSLSFIFSLCILGWDVGGAGKWTRRKRKCRESKERHGQPAALAATTCK